ncbi:MAG TPA: sterol-binding protein [Rhodoblastus sp.]|nr:sterol-binding protein [Rhodoblastus sp.]
MAILLSSPAREKEAAPTRLAPSLPLFLLQPLLTRIVRRIATNEPDMFDRLGPHRSATFVIDPVNLPFALVLRPQPDRPEFFASARSALPACDARIAGKFLDLLHLVDCDEDGDAMFFSRGIDVSGNVEAVVCLRNALDNVDGSIAAQAADMFGPPGRFALDFLRSLGAQQNGRRA